MGLVSEFKDFVKQGNVLDLAVGLVIGGAFGKIITSLVDDIIMPPVGKMMGGVSFKDLFTSLDGKVYESLAKAKEAGAPVLAYGNFIQNILDFIIIAFCVFLFVRAYNKMKKAEAAAPAAPAAPSTEEVLLTDIRDLLKKHNDSTGLSFRPKTLNQALHPHHVRVQRFFMSNATCLFTDCNFTIFRIFI